MDLVQPLNEKEHKNVVQLMKDKSSCNCTSRKWLFQIGGQDSPDSQSKTEISPIYRTSQFSLDDSPLPLVTVGKKHYYVVSFLKTTFFDAYFFCKRHSMDLVQLMNKEEHNLMVQLMKDNNMDVIWLGGTDIETEGQFIWMTTGKPVSWRAYGSNQPDNTGNKEHCLELTSILERGKYVWNDNSCQVKLNFVCQVSTCKKFCV